MYYNVLDNSRLRLFFAKTAFLAFQCRDMWFVTELQTCDCPLVISQFTVEALQKGWFSMSLAVKLPVYARHHWDPRAEGASPFLRCHSHSKPATRIQKRLGISHHDLALEVCPSQLCWLLHKPLGGGPEIRVSPVILIFMDIFPWIFSLGNHPASYGVSPWLWKPPIL